MNYITINKDIELDVDEVLDELSLSDIMEFVGDDSMCEHLSDNYEDEQLIEMLDIRIPSVIDLELLDDTEKQVLLWDLIKGETNKV